MDSASAPLAVIVGGTSGIGLACAERLAGESYQVLVTGRNKTRGVHAVSQIGAKYPAPGVEFVTFDSGNPAHYHALTEAINARGVDTLILSAAMGMQAPLLDTPPDTVRDMLELNLIAPLRIIQGLRPKLSPRASIVLISSDAGIYGEQALGAYSVTKAALNMMGKMLALDLAPSQVRVNVVCPGDTLPGMRYLLRPGEMARSSDDYLAWPLPPRGRLGRSEDTAELVAFLASSKADFITGTVTLIDGGSGAGRPIP